MKHQHAVEHDVDPAEWDAFVASVAGDTIAQTSAWARTKDSRFAASTLGVRDGSELVAGCLIMRGRIGPVDVMLAPRGPLLRSGSEHLADLVIEQILALAGFWRAGAIVLQPASQPPELDRALRSAGFSAAPVDITTPATVEIPLDGDIDALFAGLRSSRRRNIRKATKAGVEVRCGGHSDLATFHRLHSNTARRQGFAPMSQSYLDRQWEELGTTGMLSIHLAELDGAALSAATVTTFGDRAVFKLAGLSEDPIAADVRASDFLHWRVMCDAKKRGFRYYDLGGFDKSAARLISSGVEPPEEIRASASQFKLGFGGEVKLLPEAQWRVAPPFARPFQRPVTVLSHRSARVQSFLMRYRD